MRGRLLLLVARSHSPALSTAFPSYLGAGRQVSAARARSHDGAVRRAGGAQVAPPRLDRRRRQPAVGRRSQRIRLAWRRKRDGRPCRSPSSEHTGHADIVGIHAAIKDGHVAVARHADACLATDGGDRSFPDRPAGSLSDAQWASGSQAIREGEQEKRALCFFASRTNRA